MIESVVCKYLPPFGWLPFYFQILNLHFNFYSEFMHRHFEYLKMKPINFLTHATDFSATHLPLRACSHEHMHSHMFCILF